MTLNPLLRNPRHREAGVSLVIVAIALVVLLMLAGLGIDLASLYAGHAEAQRAADAAALAGAEVFATSGCTSSPGGCTPGGFQEALASQQAQLIGDQNHVGGQFANILSSDISFNYPTPKNPQITVTVQRTSARGTPDQPGGAMPTFFAKIFGVLSADISASATAEAFNPAGSNIPVGTKCVKPWLIPNCDYTRLVGKNNPNANNACPAVGAQYPSYFLSPNQNYDILNPGPAPSGVIGQLLQVKPGDPSQSSAPSQFYPVSLSPGSTPSVCPSCSSGGGGGGASLYRSNIECCNQGTVVCGLMTIQPTTGNMVGPTQQGVQCLIHQSGGGNGQDVLDPTTMTITAGGNNPYFPSGSVLTDSDSLVTAPIYDGTTLCPGNSCPSTVNVNIIGFVQMFIKRVTNPQGTVEAYVVNVAGCGTKGGGGGGGNGNPIVAGGASPIPVRLIHQ
jgi:Putative Flp pilus-assembly TadE/G-like